MYAHLQICSGQYFHQRNLNAKFQKHTKLLKFDIFFLFFFKFEQWKFNIKNCYSNPVRMKMGLVVRSNSKEHGGRADIRSTTIFGA